MASLLSIIFMLGVATHAATGFSADPPVFPHPDESERDRLRERMRIASEQGDFRQRYWHIDLPILAEARNDPEALWRFLTDPATPYLERQAAAHRCAEVFAPEHMPRLRRALDELRAHAWAVGLHPMSSSLPQGGHRSSAKDERPLIVLGHEWMPPDEPIEHPLTWEEHVAAPWPWQVEQALQSTWGTLRNKIPRHNRSRVTSIALALPRATDEEAMLFLEVSLVAIPTDELLAAKYEIALDPQTPNAAYWVTHVHLDFVRSVGVKDATYLAAAFVEDVIRHSPHERARDNAAYRLREFSRETDPRFQRQPPIVPYAAVIAACERAVDENTGAERVAARIARGHDMTHALQWHRLYVYAFSVCETIPDPPLRVDRRMGSRSPLVSEMHEQFEAWFKANRADFEAKAAEQQDRIERARVRLRPMQE